MNKKEVTAEIEKLWKEIVSNREGGGDNVRSEDGYVEEELEIKTWKRPGEYNCSLCGSPSLRQRAINGLKTLKAYDSDDNGLETDLSDLISDLFHLAYQAGCDPDEIVRMAHVHFDAEIKGDF